MRIAFNIAKFTVLEAFRDNFIWVVAALLVSSVPLGYFIESITLFGAETARPITTLTVLSIAVIAVSVLYVNIATRRELDSRIMLVILSRPVPNLVYLIGKHLGFWFLTLIYCAAAFLLIIALKIGTADMALLYVLGLWLMQALVIGWSLFFALLVNSIAGGVIASFLAWFFCTSIETMWYLAALTVDNKLAKLAGSVFYYLMPDYGRYDFKHAILYNDPVNVFNLMLLPLYTLIYSIIILLLAWIDFSRKEY